MTLFEKCVTGGDEKADELAKDGTILDGGVMAQIRASTVQQRRKEVTQRCSTLLAKPLRIKCLGCVCCFLDSFPWL